LLGSLVPGVLVGPGVGDQGADDEDPVALGEGVGDVLAELPERLAGVPGGFVVDPLPRVVLPAPVDQDGEFGDLGAGVGEPHLGGRRRGCLRR
jgi:hypothetical protein